jgi:hypothetical protein
MGFFTTEGTDMESEVGGVIAFFVGFSTNVPGATNGLIRFGGDHVAVVDLREDGTAVFESCGCA